MDEAGIASHTLTFRTLPIGRTRIFAGASIIAVVNALSSRIHQSLEMGFWQAFAVTFDVSAIVWLALVVIAALALATPPDDASDHARAPDVAAAAIMVSVATFSPSSDLAKLLLVPFALWGVGTSRTGTLHRRIALIVLALTLTTTLGSLLLHMLPELMVVDAHFAGWAIGGAVHGNTFAGPDGHSLYAVGRGCSSFSNMSMATIFGVTMTQYFNVRFDPGLAATILLASLLSVGVNVLRLATIALRPDQFRYWHDGGGAVIFAWLAFAMIVGVVGWGVDRRTRDARG